MKSLKEQVEELIKQSAYIRKQRLELEKELDEFTKSVGEGKLFNEGDSKREEGLSV